MSTFILGLVDKLSKCFFFKCNFETIYFLAKVFLLYFALYHPLKSKVFTTLLGKYLDSIYCMAIFFFSFLFFHIYCDFTSPENVTWKTR